MMSLFSPFDLSYFYKSISITVLIITFFFSSLYFFSSTFLFLNTLKSNLSSFFFSLKSKSFNKFTSFLFLCIFFSLVVMNFFSVFSFNFPSTSQVSIVFFISMGFWLSLTLYSLISSSKKLIYHFIPEGTPLPLTFFLFFIELVSTLIRPLTLTVRLVANILAGHLLMILLSQLAFIFPTVLPLYVVLNLVEIFVSLIQAYIFTTMLVLYFSEV